jgi:hypothetical protein
VGENKVTTPESTDSDEANGEKSGGDVAMKNGDGSPSPKVTTPAPTTPAKDNWGFFFEDEDKDKNQTSGNGSGEGAENTGDQIAGTKREEEKGGPKDAESRVGNSAFASTSPVEENKVTTPESTDSNEVLGDGAGDGLLPQDDGEKEVGREKSEGEPHSQEEQGAKIAKGEKDQKAEEEVLLVHENTRSKKMALRQKKISTSVTFGQLAKQKKTGTGTSESGRSGSSTPPVKKLRNDTLKKSQGQISLPTTKGKQAWNDGFGKTDGYDPAQEARAREKERENTGASSDLLEKEVADWFNRYPPAHKK